MSIDRVSACVTLAVVSLIARTAVAEDGPVIAEHRLELIGGLGLTFTSDSSRDRSGDGAQDGRGEGGFAEVEYVFRPGSVFSPRLYGGLLVTFPQHDSCHIQPACDVEAQIGFMGAKLRVMAPIPWFGPYIELGLGLSAGEMRTLDGPIDETSSGVVPHIPVALGIALGRRNQYDFAFSYLFHPGPRQVGGAVAFGFGFPIQ